MKQLRLFVLPLLFFVVLLSGLPTCRAAAPVYFLGGQPQQENTAGPSDDVKILEPYNDIYSRFTDRSAGYSLPVPAGMQPDLSEAAVRTVFRSDGLQIEIYYDNLDGTPAAAADYIYYGNGPTLKNPWHTILRDEWTKTGGLDTHVLEWNRPKLARVAGDKNHYVSAEFVKNEKEVYTVFIKSAQPFPAAREILAGFRLEEKQGSMQNYREFRQSGTKLSAETGNFLKQYFAPESSLTWGIFEPSAPEVTTYLTALENKLEYRFPFLLRYQGLDEQAPVRSLQKAYADQRYVELTLQTTFTEDVNALAQRSGRNATIMYAILDGEYDDYFREYANRLKSFGHPVLFRLNNEMNGDWCWYSAYYAGKDTDIYKAVWKHIRSIFDEAGVDNVLWVWNPHDLNRPEFKWNHYLMYYPGDEYVDIIGLTGYNTGTYFPGETWRSFADIYTPLYAEYSETFAKPFMITEFGANSVGGDKPAWLSAMFDQIKKYPNIKAAIWWNGTDWDQQGNAGRIYVLDETDRTTEVFHKRLQEYKEENRLVPKRLTVPQGMLEYPQADKPELTPFNQAMHETALSFAKELDKPALTGSLNYRVDRNSGNLLSVTLTKFFNPDRAAHPMIFRQSFTYDSRTGKALALADLFRPGAPYEAELNRQIAYQIKERSLPLLHPFTGIKPGRAQDFFLTPDSLVLYYQLYEYTPYVYGFPAFAVPLADLRDLLKEEWQTHE